MCTSTLLVHRKCCTYEAFTAKGLVKIMTTRFGAVQLLENCRRYNANLPRLRRSVDFIVV